MNIESECVALNDEALDAVNRGGRKGIVGGIVVGGIVGGIVDHFAEETLS